MKITNLTYKVIISIGILITIGAFIIFKITDNLEAENFGYIGLWFTEVTSFFILFLNGTFIKTKYFRIVKGLIALVIIGAMFKILHYSYSNLIITIGFIGIIASYTSSFLKKPLKNRLDYIKLIWVFVAFLNSILLILKLIGNEYQLLPTLVLLLAVIEYFKIEIKKNKTKETNL